MSDCEHDWMLVISTELEKYLNIWALPWDQRICRTCGRAEAGGDSNTHWFDAKNAFIQRYETKYYKVWSKKMNMLVNSIKDRK